MRRRAVVIALRPDRSVDFRLDAGCLRCEGRGCRGACAALFGTAAATRELNLPSTAIAGEARVGAVAAVEAAGGLAALARRGPGRLLAGLCLGALAGQSLAEALALAADLAVAGFALGGFLLGAATLGAGATSPLLRARILIEPTSPSR